MKIASVCTLVLVLCSNVWGQFSIIHQFDDQLQHPRSTGIYEGSVYGFTDYSFAPSEIPQDVARLFSFDLDGANVRSRNVIYEVGGYATAETGRGPLTIEDGVIYATQDLGAAFTASTTTLVPTRGPRRGFNWMNPIIVNDNVAAGAGVSEPYGVRFEPLSGAPELNVNFASAPVQSITTDGSKLFASSLGRDSDFEGKLVSITTDGAVQTIKRNFFSTYSLAYDNDRIFGFGEEGLYRINTDGTGYEVLTDQIVGARILVDGETIYGLAGPLPGDRQRPEGLFRINTDGSDFELLHEFGPGSDNGTDVNPDLVIIGSTLYGSTQTGGENDRGTYYSYQLGPANPNAVPEPTSMTVWLLLVCTVVGWSRYRNRISV